MEKTMHTWFLLWFCLTLPGQLNGQATSVVEQKCDFTAYKPLSGSDLFPADFAVKMQAAKYPQIAKDAKVEGAVQLMVLVDRNGNVIRTCVINGHPLLNASARKAALGWKFKKHFGGTSASLPGVRYAKAFVTFNFTLAH
jgi:TonB family protein